MKRQLSALSLLLMLTACILVDDFGSTWKEASPDPCLDKITESLYAGEFNRELGDTPIAEVARGWTYMGENFILLKKSAGDLGGRLYRFRVHNGIFERYRLNPTMRAAFEKDYPNAPVSLKRDTVTIALLNKETKALLIAVSKKPEYWEFEDKNLYNSMRNPTCRFEDRDLKKLEEDEQKKARK